jgi:hypothetical protein
MLKGDFHFKKADSLRHVDIWPGTPIYAILRWKTDEIPNVPERVFANVVDVNAAGKQGDDVVAYYTQIYGDAATRAGLWAFNTVSIKVADHKITGYEIDMMNEYADEDMYSLHPSAGQNIVAVGTKKMWVGCQVASVSSTEFGPAASHCFRVAFMAYQAFDQIGLRLISAVSNPDTYIDLVPIDDANPYSGMIKLVNAAYNKELFKLYKNGAIDMCQNDAAAHPIRFASGYSAGTYLIATDGTTGDNILSIGVPIAFNLFGPITIRQTTEPLSVLSGLKIGETFARCSLFTDSVAFGPGSATFDCVIARGSSGQMLCTSKEGYTFYRVGVGWIIEGQLSGETYPRVVLSESVTGGSIAFGLGSVSPDVSIERYSSGGVIGITTGNLILSTDLWIGGKLRTVTGGVKCSLVPDTTGTFGLGSSDYKWSGLYLTYAADVGWLNIAGTTVIDGSRVLQNVSGLGNISGVISDTQHGSRGSGLHSDSHPRSHDHSNLADGSDLYPYQIKPTLYVGPGGHTGEGGDLTVSTPTGPVILHFDGGIWYGAT